jgi:hypothetical protein
MAKILVRPAGPTDVDRKYGFRPWVQVDDDQPISCVWLYFGLNFSGPIEFNKAVK